MSSNFSGTGERKISCPHMTAGKYTLTPIRGKDQRAVLRRVTGRRNWQIPRRKPSCWFKASTVTVASCWDVCRYTKFVLFVF